MGLLQKYNVNIANIESINVFAEAGKHNWYLYRVRLIDIEGIPNNISVSISNELENQGNIETESKFKDFLVDELGLTSPDLIQIKLV